MFRQSFFNRYPRIVLTLIAIVICGIVWLGITTLSGIYPG